LSIDTPHQHTKAFAGSRNTTQTGIETNTSNNALSSNNALHLLSKKLLPGAVMLWVFAGGFVIFEPSPYELMFLVVLPLAFFGGMNIHRRALGLFKLMVIFLPFSIIGAFQVRIADFSTSLTFSIVTVFLWFTGYFAANYIAENPHKRLGDMIRAYTWVAVFISIVGTLAYLDIIPGSDVFLLYDRVKATFQDPNVFGPFLIVPAAFALQRALMDTGKRAFWGGVVYGILFVGVFVSFSRAAWGYIILTSAIVFVACFLLEASARDRARMIAITMAGIFALLIALVALLSIDSVAELFLQRFSLEQVYDSGTSGRFGRQIYAMELALSNPLGIGPLEFRNLRVTEDPHNTYVTVILSYGWIGGLAYISMIWMTMKNGAGALLKASPNRLLMIPLMANFIPLSIEAAIIDTDHWRHLFLLVGMIWGVYAGYGRTNPEQMDKSKRLI